MKNPATAKEDLKKQILSYVNMALPIKNGMSDEVWEKFQAFQQSDSDEEHGLNIVKPPYLEVAKEYARAKYSLAQLSREEGGNLLHPDVADAFAKYLLDDDNANPEKVFPYLHQYRALKEVRSGKNLVVCTGTGSGKTECFLLPLIDAIYRAHVEAGDNYDPHIRALILYPMNALVNDQISRLRRLLRYLPDITFGQYIGTTAKDGVEVEVEGKLINDVREFEQIPENETSGFRPVECLTNEYRTRSRWKDAPADILVTNYSMLERLLLVPEKSCGFFSKCWDFIVIDEAHSYNGSVGTEIAWLMRRLEKRLKRNSADANKQIQFLATSATLSDGDDWADKAQDFASNIFPVDKDTIHAEAGEFAEHESKEGGHRLTVPLQEFFDANKKTYDETISYESEAISIKAAVGDIELMRKILDRGGKVACEELYVLSKQFDLGVKSPIGQDEYPDLKMSEALAVLAKLTLKKVNIMRNGKPGKPEDKDNWRYFLHDVTIKASSSLSGDTVMVTGGGNVQNRYGNRLDILDVWKEMAAEDPEKRPVTIPYIVFYFMYAALLEMLHDDSALYDNLNLNRIILEVSDTVKDRFKTEISSYDKRTETAADTSKRLDAAWRTALGNEGSDKHYPELIYDCIVDHEQVVKFRKLSEGTPKSLDEYAKEMNISPQDFLKFASIGALARTSSRRNAVIEVRYHQVVRDVSDVGVYFNGGKIDEPKFVRLDAENAVNGEKVFTLGICRNCGQPYLLGYSDECTFTDRSLTSCSPRYLMRAETPSYKYMHAVAIGTPKLMDDETEVDPDKDERWLNLRTGELSDTKTDGSEWTKVYWLASPKEETKGDGDNYRSPSFISECPRCRNKQNNNKAKYGILTPYEAVGEQYKIAVLDAFASLSEEDSDEKIRKNATAGGRKVLAFSDSRSQAAQLACKFETVKARRLVDKITFDLVSSGPVKILTQGAKEEDEALRKLKLQDKETLEELRKKLRTNPDNWRVTSSIDALIERDNSSANLFKDKLEKLRYQQLLEWEDEDGHLMDDAKTVAKFMILKAVRDAARNGLLSRNLIDVRSAQIESKTDWNDLESSELGISAEAAKEICQQIYRHLVLRCRVGNLPKPFLKKDGNGGYRGDYLDVYERKGISCVGFRTADKRHAVYKTCLLPCLGRDLESKKKKIAQGWLEGVFHRFTEWNILQPAADGEYQLNFEQLCGDLEIIRGKGKSDLPEVIPFSVEEHTAQIKGLVGALYQKAFAEGKINILSCSTTFEMGIDVGGLNNVFLGNLPPSSSNYRQRAGRAGRRPGAAAYILSLAGQSAHDRNYFADIPSLFWGKIDPPRIYLEKPVFAARHFRAEALHDLLEYVVKESGDCKDWEKVSHFILGRSASSRNGKNSNPKKVEKNYLASRGEEWLEKRGDSIANYVSTIKDYGRFKEGLGEDITDQYYSPANDLMFQLSGSVPVKNSQEAFRFYQNMGGCRLPERKDDSTVDSTNLKRMALDERLKRQLYIRRNRNDTKEYGVSWPENPDKAEAHKLTIAQVRLLQKRTIDILCETCVLPRYGFPVDEIELLPNNEELFRDVELRRPLQLGLFEYAPGQIVFANKRLYESGTAAFWRYPKKDGKPDESLAGHLSKNASFCRHCHKIFEVDAEQNDCPLCGQPLDESLPFITPDVFYANKSIKGYVNKVPKQRGRRIVRWGGELISEYKVKETSLRTAESSDRMMQYINTNAGDKGFFVRAPGAEGNYYYVHEIQTNIAIWRTSCKLPFADQHTVENISRFDNACLSAAYALQRSCARKLDITVRELGVLYMRIDNDPKGRQAQFVFYDEAAGGGGNALSLTKVDDDDTKTEELIRNIIDGAIEALENDGNDLCIAVDKTRMPLPVNIYRSKQAKGEADGYRPAVSCYKCLKDFDNQDVHPLLDKYDAIEILKALRASESESANESSESESADGSEWIPFDPAQEQLTSMKWYKKTDGTIVQYNPMKPSFSKTDVAYRKVYHD